MAVFLVALVELQYQFEVPAKVAINEAIELCRRFGATDSHKYVNAILDRAAKMRESS
jgi:N utilization substance protein B